MREHLNSDSLFIHSINEKIISGDSNAIKLKHLLSCTYETRLSDSSFTEEEIKIIVYGFNISHRTIIKFRQLDESLKDLY